MKISVDDKELFTLSNLQKLVIQNDIPSEIFEDDIRRRIKWILVDEKYRKCFERLKKEWEPKLSSRFNSLPTDPDEFAKLVFSQPDYKSRSVRDKESNEIK